MRTISILLAVLAPAVAAQEEKCGARVSLDTLWKHIVAEHDKDGDGRVTTAEYVRGEVRFANYDRNKDGFLTREDFPEGAFINEFNASFARQADGDRNNEVTKEEWQKLLTMLDGNGDGTFSMGELGKRMPPVMTSRPSLVLLSYDQNLDGVFDVKDTDLMFGDLDQNGDGTLQTVELQRRKLTWERPGTPLPKVGEVAPDFELSLAEQPERQVKLSSFRGKRPVALIFGSYT